MAINTYERLRSLVLSAIDIKQLTNWPDAMIEDYLTLIEGLIELATTIDSNNNLAKNVQRSVHYEGVKTDFVEIGNASVATNNTTTFGNQTIICNNTLPITVTLNATPNNFETVNVKRMNKEIKIDGNGRLIDNASSVTLKTRYTGLHFIYTVDNDSWVIV